MSHAQTIALWQQLNENWARCKTGELGIPYEPLWDPPPAKPREENWEQEQVYLLWAEMHWQERKNWLEHYPELRAIPDDMIKAERARLKRMRETELVMRSRGQLAPVESAKSPELTTERRMVSAEEIAEEKKRKRRQAS